MQIYPAVHACSWRAKSCSLRQNFCRAPSARYTATAGLTTALKWSTNGRPPSPGRRYTVHFRQPGLGGLPLSPT
jgi:hypothetical protein